MSFGRAISLPVLARCSHVLVHRLNRDRCLEHEVGRDEEESLHLVGVRVAVARGWGQASDLTRPYRSSTGCFGIAALPVTWARGPTASQSRRPVLNVKHAQ